jgi:hypothetical protein
MREKCGPKWGHVSGTIKKLAARLLRIQGTKLVEVCRFGTDAGGHVVFDPAVAFPIKFVCGG